MDLRAATLLVTGGASGLGAATARALVERGGRVVVADLNVAAGTALAEALGPSARFAPCDVTDARQIEQALQLAEDDWGGVTGVVHCAGILHARRIVGRDGPHDLESFARVVQVNLVGTFNVVRLAAARLATRPPNDEGERGVLVLTASIAAFDGQIGQAAYAASKGGVAAMTLPLARDVARHGIRVVTIAPGVFETPMMAAAPPELRESLTAQIPFPARFGKPSEFADLALHIVGNPLLNGEVIRLDGAVRMGPK